MNSKEVLEMTKKERDRLVLLRQVMNGSLKQILAAKMLGISTRQVRNLITELKKHGDSGIVSKKRGKPGNHRKPTELKEKILRLMRETYVDFGPTFASEKLAEREQIEINSETLRLWMHNAGLLTKKTKKAKSHKPRERRHCFGELIQVDGSHHRWLGPENEMMNLTVFIDDATSMVTGLYLSKTETLDAYFQTLEQHLVQFGRPLAIYADHSAICEVRQGDSSTQLHKTLEALGIQLILANSPEAKGRVERVNQTFQDRLIKELALRGIKTMEGANQFFPEYLPMFNERFEKEPISAVNAHRPLDGFDLSTILRRHKQRTLMKCGIFQYDNQFYEVQGLAENRVNKGRKVDLYIARDGSFRTFMQGIEHSVSISPAKIYPKKPPTMTRKEVLVQAEDETRKPSKKIHLKAKTNHPWRKWVGMQQRHRSTIGYR